MRPFRATYSNPFVSGTDGSVFHFPGTADAFVTAFPGVLNLLATDGSLSNCGKSNA